LHVQWVEKDIRRNSTCASILPAPVKKPITGDLEGCHEKWHPFSIVKVGKSL
jgi:hypothetical protein